MRIFDLWTRTQEPGFEADEAAYQLEDLVDNSVPLVALFALGEKPDSGDWTRC